MPSVRFTRNILRHVECPTLEVSGATLREVLDAYFQSNAPARGYVLDYRHALDVDEAGKSLAMGSTTGSLWTSDDGGDSSRLIVFSAQNFNLVYAKSCAFT